MKINLKHKNTKDILKFLIYFLLSIVLFITPLLKSGMLWEKENLYINFIIYVIFLLWAVYKNVSHEKIHIDSAMFICMITLTIAYVIPFVFGYAEDKSGAITHAMRYIAYAFLFFVISDMLREKENLLLIGLYIITIPAVLTAFIGIDSIAGRNIINLFNLDGIGIQMGRLYGIMKYPNVTGIYLATGFFMLLGLCITNEKKYFKSMYSAIMYIMFTTLLLTVSRGAILIFPIVYVVFLFVVPEKRIKIESFLITIVPIAVSLILYSKLSSVSPVLSNGTGSVGGTWFIILLGIVISFILSYLSLFILKPLENVSDKIYTIAIVLIVLLVIISVIIIFTTELYKKIIPPFLLDRLTQTGEMATSGRITFYNDAFKIIKDYWLLGAGGGGWEALYRFYQSYNYPSSEAHSFILQAWIETGLLGLISYIGIMFIVAKKFLLNKRSKNPLMVSVFLSIVILLISHSVIDIGFSLSPIPIIVFALLGAVESQNLNNSKIKIKVSSYIPIGIGTLLCFIGIMFISSRFYAVQATKIMNSGGINIENLNGAKSKLEIASKLNPFNSDYYVADFFPEDDIEVDMNLIYDYMFEQLRSEVDRTVFNEYIEITEKALKLNSKSGILNRKIASTVIKIRSISEDKASEYIEKAVYYNPMNPLVYQELSDIYIKIGEYYLKDNRKQRGNSALSRVIQIQSDIQKVNTIAIYPIELTEKTVSNIQKAEQMIVK